MKESLGILSNEQLIVAINSSIQLQLSAAFISQLKRELIKRGNTHEQFKTKMGEC